MGPGVKSQTMTGELAVRDHRLGELQHDGDELGDVMFYHYPSTWNHWMPDHAISFRVLPISPTETEVLTTWLVPREAKEGVDYDLQSPTEVWEETNRQDVTLVEGTQVGVQSPAYAPGSLNPLHEKGVLEFLEWYSGLMKARLAEE